MEDALLVAWLLICFIKPEPGMHIKVSGLVAFHTILPGFDNPIVFTYSQVRYLPVDFRFFCR
jgi:hypothetical protein